MSKKVLGKFNWVDIIIVVAVIAAVGIVAYKFLKPAEVTNSAKTQKIEMEFFVEEAPDYSVDIVKEGDKVYDETKNCVLGNVVSVEVGDSINYGVDDSGNFVKSSKEGYKSIRITTEVDGEMGENGVTVGVTRYGVGHTFTFYAGNAKLYGKVSAINPIGG